MDRWIGLRGEKTHFRQKCPNRQVWGTACLQDEPQKSRPALIVAFLAAAMVGGCTFVDEAVLPSMFGGGQAARPVGQPIQPPIGQGDVDPSAYGIGNPQMAQAGSGVTQPLPGPQAPFPTPSYYPAYQVPGVIPGPATNTIVGERVRSQRQDLQELQVAVTSQVTNFLDLRTRSIQDATRYHNTVAGISGRLGAGTTPGNPELVQSWSLAQSQLEQVNENLTALNQLSSGVARNATVGNYLLEAVRATFLVSGAVDEDHRQLRTLEDEASRTINVIDRLLADITEDTTRQTAYVSAERSNLSTLSAAINKGELYGGSLGGRQLVAPSYSGQNTLAPAGSWVNDSAPGSGLASGRPLVTIRFDNPNVPYQNDLYAAVNEALRRRPDAYFDLVAFSPRGGTEAEQVQAASLARRYAEEVKRNLHSMGLPEDRIAIATMGSDLASVSEVQLYVR